MQSQLAHQLCSPIAKPWLNQPNNIIQEANESQLWRDEIKSRLWLWTKIYEKNNYIKKYDFNKNYISKVVSLLNSNIAHSLTRHRPYKKGQCFKKGKKPFIASKFTILIWTVVLWASIWPLWLAQDFLSIFEWYGRSRVD